MHRLVKLQGVAVSGRLTCPDGHMAERDNDETVRHRRRRFGRYAAALIYDVAAAVEIPPTTSPPSGCRPPKVVAALGRTAATAGQLRVPGHVVIG
ncbi:hypothetical protein RHA1_ro03557 [Rhodococcus jostii RHA1]|uniref:Uncharacterized protein n=1 Tax=Rhodococcus jostii (strain RHA1) TaxID=101510 RepID=Q0SAS6_RHOJR|nr:hypothetical protein RHA1_ro03557 [Rhodococcus jostii RHA1]